tara:strand:- start:12108 stop:12518 length:411 start_codon:yes stop_codon:yes gene_type:complete
MTITEQMLQDAIETVRRMNAEVLNRLSRRRSLCMTPRVEPDLNEDHNRSKGTTMTYRVYAVPDGSDISYCGEFLTLGAAQAAAEREPAGLDRSEWDTARAAGSCGGQYSPESADESEPISWHGPMGFHCVVRATHC